MKEMSSDEINILKKDELLLKLNTVENEIEEKENSIEKNKEYIKQLEEELIKLK